MHFPLWHLKKIAVNKTVETQISGQPHKNIHLEKYFPRWIFLNVFHNFLKSIPAHILNDMYM